MDYIVGGILFILGIVIMLYFTWYGGKAWKQKAPPSLIVGLIGIFGFWLVIFSIRLFGATVAFSTLIALLVYAMCGYTTSIIMDKTGITTDNIIMTILYIFLAIVLIVNYWWFKIEGGEAFLEAFFKNIFKK